MIPIFFYFWIAQTATDVAALRQFADEASQKDFRWWFAIVFAILIASGTIVFRMLIKQRAEDRDSHAKQMAEQRESNAAITTQFIANMKEDRLKTMVLLERVTMVLERLEEDKRIEVLSGRQRSNQLPSHPHPSPSDES